MRVNFEIFKRRLITKLKTEYYSKTSKIRKKSIKNPDLTIISNNCWGGIIYNRYNLKYNSPTIGLFIMPDEYLKMIKNLKHYISHELEFINPNDSRYYDYLKRYPNFGIFPIGKLDDIEIVFLHYSSEKEAYEKWNRRCKRINWEKILIKFCDQNLCEYKHIQEFNSLKFTNKICYTSNQYPELKSTIFLKSAKGKSEVGIDDELFIGTKEKEITKIINELK